jgi:8-oxo-dGTP pyrophosphatase MutT (NUDIX family)
MERVEKVVAYIVRGSSLVAFLHERDANPVLESGLQVPAGTVEPGEQPIDAVLREATEETGLRGLRVVRFLGDDEVDSRPARAERLHRHFFELAVDGEVPDRWRHVEEHAGPAHQREPFVLFWLPLERGGLLAAAQGVMIGRLCDPIGHGRE